MINLIKNLFKQEKGVVYRCRDGLFLKEYPILTPNTHIGTYTDIPIYPNYTFKAEMYNGKTNDFTEITFISLVHFKRDLIDYYVEAQSKYHLDIRNTTESFELALNAYHRYCKTVKDINIEHYASNK